MKIKYTFPMLALCVASLASANSDVFNDLDTNQDMVVSQEEAAQLPILGEVWAELDTDNDGVLSQAEFANIEINVQPENGEVAE
ncbi:calmodulin [Agarivorans sp. MS3-6]|uniref:calmodulin n=1 Tax=Agarivorans sp. TSD2052 TaxID=2937286 RepID=UPI00200FF9B2|nr:calmodulin [Agarivorans sp. TSD2052]UPW19650.1 calmodulin [Agarivorans sp. TSD2052]